MKALVVAADLVDGTEAGQLAGWPGGQMQAGNWANEAPWICQVVNCIIPSRGLVLTEIFVHVVDAHARVR